MMRQFWFELVIGMTAFISMILYGAKGMVVMALLTFLPLALRNQKADEREYYLFYKTGNYTMGLFMIALTLINQYQYYTGSMTVEKNWLGFSAAAFLIIHGLTGIAIFKTN